MCFSGRNKALVVRCGRKTITVCTDRHWIDLTVDETLGSISRGNAMLARTNYHLKLMLTTEESLSLVNRGM